MLLPPIPQVGEAGRLGLARQADVCGGPAGHASSRPSRCRFRCLLLTCHGICNTRQHAMQSTCHVMPRMPRHNTTCCASALCCHQRAHCSCPTSTQRHDALALAGPHEVPPSTPNARHRGTYHRRSAAMPTPNCEQQAARPHGPGPGPQAGGDPAQRPAAGGCCLPAGAPRHPPAPHRPRIPAGACQVSGACRYGWRGRRVGRSAVAGQLCREWGKFSVVQVTGGFQRAPLTAPFRLLQRCARLL